MRIPPYLQYVLRLSIAQKKRFSILVALLIFTTAARLTEPYLYKVVVDTLTTGLVDKVITSAQTETLMMVVAFWFLLAVIINVSSAQSSYLSWLIGNENSQTAHMEGYRRLLKLDYIEHTKKHSSKLVDIVEDADTSMWEMTNWWTHRFFAAFLGFLGMVIIALTVSWQMTLVALAVLPPGLWFIVRSVVKYEAEQRHVNKLWKAKGEHLSDQVTNIVTYKLNPFEQIFLERQAVYVRDAQNAQDNLNKKWRLVEMLNFDAVARFLVMGTGIVFVRNGSITLGTLFMFMGLLNEILTPLHVLGDILPNYSRRAQYINRFLELLNKSDVITVPEKAVSAPQVEGNVTFQNVSFSYSADAHFGLRDISFEILAGQTFALVGHSGSGKTTIMTLLNRLVDPTSGSILIDGVDIRAYNLEEIKRHVGTVLQENAMYNESVADNIAYGNPHASREEIIRAAHQAHAHDFIERLPKKYDTLIGERGVRLSGGEKQRIAIARAMLKNPKIVVLDEPTSALDSITEQKVQRGLNELMKGRTTLIIAHRLSTVRHADTILVLEAGQIIGRGSHAELLESCPTYQRMVELQIGGFLADE